MKLYRLSTKRRVSFAEVHEIRMGIQAAMYEGGPAIVIATQVLAVLDINDTALGVSPFRDFSTYHMASLSRAAILGEENPSGIFNSWIRSLPEAPENIRVVDADEDAIFASSILAYFILRAKGPIPTPPARPPHVYGHLPFTGVCTDGDVFYRFESSPTSWRVNQSTGEISGGTYGCPPSELPMIPSGLAAVARYALPSVLPARWRYEIRPEPGTIFRYGASVPLYGQSGGGVEVMFPNDFKNVGPIANPVIMPEL